MKNDPIEKALEELSFSEKEKAAFYAIIKEAKRKQKGIVLDLKVLINEEIEEALKK